MRLFFSYHSCDTPLVRQIVSALPPWLKRYADEDHLCFGSQRTPTVKDVLTTHTDYLVLLVNDDTAKTDWVLAQAKWVLAEEHRIGRKFVLPVLTDDSSGRLSELGLGDRRTLRVAQDDKGSVERLAHELTNHIADRTFKEFAAARAAGPIEDSLHTRAREVIDHVSEIAAPFRRHVEELLVAPFLSELESAIGGSVPLGPSAYYERIFEEMNEAGPGTLVLAVSMLSSDLWTRDVDQINYLELNFDAIERGASIQRLFVIPETHPAAFRAIVGEQREVGVNTRVASSALIASMPDLNDFVLFETRNGARAYVAELSTGAPRRIQYAYLALSEGRLERMREGHGDAWVMASRPDAFFASFPPIEKAAPPGDRLPSRRLDQPVVSCEEAAAARGIPLAKELKTLLLKTHDREIVAVHVPGDANVALRKVKRRLGTAQAYQASPQELEALGLTPGTICAIKEPVWGMEHLVTRRVLRMDTVFTNDGSKTGYFEFNPALLMKTDPIVGDFEE